MVWVRGDQIYLAAPDSIAVRQATTLTFVRGKKTVATGEVARVLDRALALARVTSGALGEKHLERVRILAEPPRAPRLLRVGYPARDRGADPFVACEQGASWAPAPPGTYRIGGSDRNARQIRLPNASLPSAWPETLEVRQFDDAADEEIALERGELDVGVFWPGELSTHMREHPRWKNRTGWTRGVIVGQRYALGVGGDAARAHPLDDSLFHALNQAVFRGDLGEMWRSLEDTADARAGPPARFNTRFDVDPRCPGRAALERFFSASRRGPPPATHDVAVDLFYVEVPDLRSPLVEDSLSRAAADFVRHGPFPALLRARADSVYAELDIEYENARVDRFGILLSRLDLHMLFRFDCQVVFEPALQPAVTAVGVGTLVNLFRCGTPASR